MEQDNLLDYLYRRLKNEHMWFVTKLDITSSWENKPKKYYTLDEYGEIKDKKKVEKEINDYIGDGAETIQEAVSLFIADAVCDGSITTTDHLTVVFKDKPVEYTDTAVEVKNVDPKYTEPHIICESYDEDDEDDEDYFEIYVEDNGEDGIVAIEKYDGRWHERLIDGDLDKSRFGKTYMSYLTKQDILQWFRNDFDRARLNESKQLKNENKEKEFICPVCGSEIEYDYDDPNTDSNGFCVYRYYKWNCDNCGSSGEVEYSVDNDIYNMNPGEYLDDIVEFNRYIIKDKKQEDIFDDVSNGKATYGVYDDKDTRNYKDRYKEPTYAKRNKIRNFKDDKFKQRSVRDIINKGVTHVDYEKMPNERVQAYKNSKKEESSDVLSYEVEYELKDGTKGKVAVNGVNNAQDMKETLIKTLMDMGYYKTAGQTLKSYKYKLVDMDTLREVKTENVQRRLEEENNKSLNLISDMFKSKDFDSDSKAGQIVMRTSNLFNVLSDKGYDVQVSFDNGESTNTILLGQQGGSILITITDTNQPLRAFTDGSFEITEDNIKILDDVRKEIETI